jgi:peptidoglycan/LPS O-acetylase OafA/YrhL
MRFISAGMVFLVHALEGHLFASQTVENTYTSVVIQGGWAAVCYFFILSGFVLTYASRPTDTPGLFWRRRFLKIYPTYVVTLAVALALTAWVAKTAIDGKAAILQALLLQSFAPGLEVRTAFNPPAWSLSCEALFYLCFPLLHRYVGRIRAERLWAWAGGIVALIFVVPIVAGAIPGQTPIPGFGLSQEQLWLIMQFPPSRMLEFVFGMIMARIVLTGRKLPVGLGGALAVGIALYALSPLLPLSYDVVAVSVVPLGLIIAAGAAQDTERRTNWLGSRVMVWLGEVSYAFYMWHFLVIVYVRTLFGSMEGFSTPMAFVVMAALFAITLVPSWLLFSLVERPIMRRFATPRRRARPAREPAGTV